MKFAEKPTQSAEYLRQAIPLMVKYKIPPNPLNYALWYTYVSKRSPKLNVELDKALETYGTCPTLVCEKMFREHLINDEIQNADHAQSKMIGLVNDLHKNAGIASQCAAEFQDVLSSSLQELRSPNSRIPREQIIESLSANTDSISKSNLAFQEQINAAQSEIAMLKQELKQTRNDPRVDHITQLFNRQVFDIELEQLIQLQDTTQASVVIFEIDDFKEFNDNYGSQMGDKIIIFIADLLKKSCVAPSLAMRYAGTKFAMLLLGANAEEAHSIADDLRKKIFSIRLRQRNSNAITNALSASFGISQMRTDDSADSLAWRTINALQTAIQQGKNQVVID
ncbi:MAG: GGDEF domain-containing protein [Pseudomonadales bacterium]